VNAPRFGFRLLKHPTFAPPYGGKVGAAGPPRSTILKFHQPRFAILRLRGSKNLNIKEFEQKHAKQTKDIPTSPFQFFRDRSKGKSKVPARSPFVSFACFCLKNLNIKELR